MALSRRDFTLGSLLAAGTLGLPVFVKAQQGKTVALLFDSLVSPFWVSGLDIMREKAQANGWQVSAMQRGMPTTSRREATLLDAIGHIMRETK